MVENAYFNAIKVVRSNFTYQIMHAKMNKAQKLECIESVMADGNALAHYRNQKGILYKEQIYEIK